jgi:hypothetical protein
MREDWNAFNNAASKTPKPTTMPNTSVGVALDSPDYFSKLAEQVQKQTKVVPTVVTLNEKFLAQEDLRNLQDIGMSIAVLGQQDYRPFPIYATAEVADFSKASADEKRGLLKKLEPSRTLTDFTGDQAFIFRITDTDPSHKPADAREVLQQVEQDLRTAGAYDLAKAEAEELRDAARGTGSSLRGAAIAIGKTVTSPGYISLQGALPTDLPVSSNSRQRFLDEAFDMLSAASSGKSVIDLIGLPRDQKVFVAQIADVRRNPMYANQTLDPQLSRQIMYELGQKMYQQWYSLDGVEKRLGYVDQTKKKDEG